ncbi:MAG TPA: prephenate dehydrogenase [Chloroflexota bacterium]|nr:prephenate dehydrogenase [Chloroflexota bacterium]
MVKLAIVGAGFVGASLGLALRPSKLFAHIAGYDHDRGRLQAAKRAGAIDEECRSTTAAVEQAAVIVVTVPAPELEAVLRELTPALSPGAIVTDTTPWKVAAECAAAVLPEDVHFVGGRPVLDNAGHGPEQASAAALRNAVYCLTPGPLASEAAVNAMSALVNAMGAQPYFLEPAEHDALTAASELLPSALLAALPLALIHDPAWVDAGKLAGDRFNRAARQAEELQASFWRDATANAPALSRWLETAASALLDLRDNLQSDNPQKLAADWDVTLRSLARWRADKRQLQESTMPPKSELRPNLFGNMSALGRLGRRS